MLLNCANKPRGFGPQANYTDRAVAACWLDDRGAGVRVPVGSRIFSSPDRPDLL
jgi:hypothetical protein